MATPAGLVAVAAFLPWVSVLGFTKTGVDGDGVPTLILALVGLALISRRWLGWIGQILPAGIVAAIAIDDLNNAGNFAAIGLYLTLVGGPVWAVAALVSRNSKGADVSST